MEYQDKTLTAKKGEGGNADRIWASTPQNLASAMA